MAEVVVEFVVSGRGACAAPVMSRPFQRRGREHPPKASRPRHLIIRHGLVSGAWPIWPITSRAVRHGFGKHLPTSFRKAVMAVYYPEKVDRSSPEYMLEEAYWWRYCGEKDTANRIIYRVIRRVIKE